MMFLFGLPDVKSFKKATELDAELRLNCKELGNVAKIDDQTKCASLGELFENANGLYFDETTSTCSIQQCTPDVYVRVIAEPSARISIMFESKFSPKREFSFFCEDVVKFWIQVK